MTGRIVKGISGFYYVYVAGSGIYECRARGVFRQKKMKPLVGDRVEIDVLSEEDKEGNLKRILPRKSELIRPAVANVDQALVIFACRDPEPNFQLLDRFLVMMEMQDIPVALWQTDCVDEQTHAALHRPVEPRRGVCLRGDALSETPPHNENPQPRKRLRIFHLRCRRPLNGHTGRFRG